jgi:hypothetical protein
MNKDETCFVSWWKNEGEQMVYNDSSHFEVAKRAWEKSQNIQIERNLINEDKQK